MEPALHPDLQSIAFLIGTWTGQGKGEYPTIDPFSYEEEVRFWHVGKPFLAYAQRTWAQDDGRPLHSEMGYWRPRPEGALEVVLSHPTGVVEVAEGRVEASEIELGSTMIGSTGSAKEVVAVTRRLEVEGVVLRYRLAMAAVGIPLSPHLAAELRRRP